MGDEVRLRFKSAYAAEFFLGQLSDGWGENHCSISPVDGHHYVTETYDVEVYSDWGDEHHEIVDEASDRQAQRIKVAFPEMAQAEPAQMPSEARSYPYAQDREHEARCIVHALDKARERWENDDSIRASTFVGEVAAIAAPFLPPLAQPSLRSHQGSPRRRRHE